MKLNRAMDFLLNFLASVPSRYAARQVRRIRLETRGGLFDDDKVTAHLSPACFRILFFVPGARSSPGCPAIVTSPRLCGCLYCRWLPRVRSRYQPASSISFMASRTFIISFANTLSHQKTHILPKVYAYNKFLHAWLKLADAYSKLLCAWHKF